MKFLKTIFREAGQIALTEKVNSYFSTKFYDDASSVVVGHLNDTYVGCCTYRKGIVKGRGKKDDVTGIHAFWVDIDFSTGEHKKEGLPTREEADAVIKDIVPTVKVFSGGGYHLWYVLKEPIDVTRQEDKELWEHRMKMFQNRFRAFFTVDATHNLDRILRVPGTMNHKRTPIEVTAEYNDDALYTWDDLQPTECSDEPCNVIKVTSNGKAPVEKIKALCAKNKAFCDVYHGKVATGDGSPSAIDYSIAVHCLKTGFEPGEVKETIIASFINRNGKRNPKHNRQDYFDRTISRAKMVAESELIVGFKIIKFVKYLSQPATYEMHTNKGNIKMDNVNDIIMPSRFKVRVAEFLDFVPSLPKSKDWEPIVTELLQNAEKVDLGTDGTDGDIIRVSLEDWINNEGACEDEVGSIFTHRGNIHIVLKDFRNWLDIKQKNSITIKKLAKFVKDLGWSPQLVRVNDEVVRVWMKKL